MVRYLITAVDQSDQRIECFTWTRDAASGIERAQTDALHFDRPDLHDFQAEKIHDRV